MENTAKKINQIVLFSLSMNIILTISKLLAGFLGNSLTLVSDGVNSLGDCFTSLMLLIVLRVANKKADREHPYGHQKYEGIIHFVLGIVVLLTAVLIMKTAIEGLVSYFGGNTEVESPEVITIIVAGVAILIKISLFIVSRTGAKRLDSVALRAASIDHLSDLLSTTVGLIGIIVASFGYIYFDYIASLIIGLIIIRASIGIIRESVTFLVDQSPDDEKVAPIRDAILKTNGVIRIDDIKVRMHMTKMYVDLEISVDKNLSLLESHNIAEKVHENVENANKDVIHCLVHVNPLMDEKT